MSLCHVIRAGLQTTVQDRGRWGWQSRGVPVAGPMDAYSFRAANALVGNLADAAALEVAFTGPELEFTDTCLLAVAGAEFALEVDGRRVPMHAAFAVRPGSRVRFGERTRGTRAYLAVGGGIDVPLVLGSRATHMLSRMGGVAGRALAAGDRLPLGVPQGRMAPRGDLTSGSSLAMSTGIVFGFGRSVETTAHAPVLRFLKDRQVDRFAEGALEGFLSAPYFVGAQSDRMGFRLEGPRLRHAHGADILSDVTPMGTLQVPSSGQPILLMADRQTTGGYARIGAVISAGLPLAGQLAPGDRVRFTPCTLDEAGAAFSAQEHALGAMERRARA